MHKKTWVACLVMVVVTCPIVMVLDRLSPVHPVSAPRRPAVLCRHGVLRTTVLPPSGVSSQSRADLRRELHPLLLLPLVAEPHPHHVLLQVQLLGDCGDLIEK